MPGEKGAKTLLALQLFRPLAVSAFICCRIGFGKTLINTNESVVNSDEVLIQPAGIINGQADATVTRMVAGNLGRAMHGVSTIVEHAVGHLGPAFTDGKLF